MSFSTRRRWARSFLRQIPFCLHEFYLKDLEGISILSEYIVSNDVCSWIELFCNLPSLKHFVFASRQNAFKGQSQKQQSRAKDWQTNANSSIELLQVIQAIGGAANHVVRDHLVGRRSSPEKRENLAKVSLLTPLVQS